MVRRPFLSLNSSDTETLASLQSASQALDGMSTGDLSKILGKVGLAILTSNLPVLSLDLFGRHTLKSNTCERVRLATPHEKIRKKEQWCEIKELDRTRCNGKN